MSLPTWTFQDRIRKAREHAGLKQEELAQAIGFTRQTLGRWENGSHTPTEKNLQALAEATGVPVGWFYQEDTAPAPAEASPGLLPPTIRTGDLPISLTVRWTPGGIEVDK